jgi:hypothetical protein
MFEVRLNYNPEYHRDNRHADEVAYEDNGGHLVRLLIKALRNQKIKDGRGKGAE